MDKPQKFVNITEQDLAAGVDFLSAESSIPEGYSQDLVNFDTVPEGYLAKRPGTQGVYGNLPVRVQSLKYAASGEITFYLDGSIDLGRLPSTPLVIYGKTSVPTDASAHFNSDAPQVHYYADFTAQVRRVFTAGGPQTLAIAADEIDIGTPYLWTGTAQATLPSMFDHSLFYPNTVTVNQTSLNVDVGYTNGTGADFAGFVYYFDATPDAGRTFVSSPVAVPVGGNTINILATTHALATSFIVPKVFVDNGVTYSEIIPNSVTVAANGDVSVGLTNSSGSSFNVVVMLTAAEADNVLEGAVDSASSVPLGPKTLEVSVPVTTPFNFYATYLRNGSTRELVIPESVVYDSTGGTATVSFINASPDASTFEVCWVPGVLASNRLVVTSGAAIPTTVLDSRPQLTVWGLDHSEIYASSSERQGWVTHLDSYKSEGERFLVAGLGGNLFKGQERTAATAEDYLIPALAPSLRARVAATVSLGPTFIDVTDMPFRTNGHIRGDNLASGWAQVSSYVWDSASGSVVVTMNIPGLSLSGVPSSIVNTTAGFEDKAVIRQAPYARLNGTWRIKQWAVNGESVTMALDIPAITSGDWNDVGGVGQLGLFSDRFNLDTTSPFIPGDRPLCSVFDAVPLLSVSNSTGTTLIVDGATDQANLPAGVRITGERTGALIPLRTTTGTPSNEGYVRGDMVSLTGYNREFRVLSVSAAADSTVSITGGGAEAVVSLPGDTANTLFVGQTILLVQAGKFSGEHVVTDIRGVDAFAFASDVEGTVSGTLAGHAIELDETLLWTDAAEGTTAAAVTGRWLPFESPEDSWNLTPSTYVRYFDESSYDNQPFLRSVMANDSLFVTNGIDRTQKVDGVNVYRPGLPRWQAQLYAAVSTAPAAGGTISINQVSTAYTGRQNNYFQVALANAGVFPIGARIRDSIDGEVYTVTSRGDDNTNAQIYVDRNITSTFAGTPTLRQTTTYSYYVRLNAVDINNNVVASAATGSQDCVLELTQDAQVRIRVVGLPILDNFDYDRLELEIYRTKSTGVAPYYRLTTLPLNFDASRGYIDYVDTDSDEDLTDLDIVNSALKGAELGTAWSDGLRAKSITSLGNSLVLANVKSDPYLTLNFVDKGERITVAALSGFRVLLKKNVADVATSSDMVNRVGLKFVSTSQAITSIAAGTNAVTFTAAGHGLAVGDWVYLFRAAAPGTNQETHLMGHWQVAGVTGTTFNISFVGNVLGALTAANEVDAFAKATLSGDIPVYLGNDYNYGWNRQATPDVAGPYERYAVLRMANALNSVMRQTDTTVAGYEQFSPWLIADAGGDFALGSITFRRPINDVTQPVAVMPVSLGNYSLFANNELVSAGETVSFLSQVFGSRVLVSYQNFPEIFDNPLTAVDSQSDSAIDVNPDDGEDITAVVPFFGDSAFGAAQKDGVLVVFKRNSIYLINLAAKRAGQNPLQRIESQNLGCTAPYSVCSIRDGILFANEAGIYKINKDATVRYLGRRLQRYWRKQVNRASLDTVQTTNWAFTNKILISVPTGDALVPDKALVYDITREYAADGHRDGSWTRYENFPALGYCNLGAASYLCTSKGRVFTRRNLQEASDYRDDNAAIQAVATLRPMSFGDSGIRKSVPYATITYRNAEENTGAVEVNVRNSVDLSNYFEDSDRVTLPDTSASGDDLSDTPSQSGETVRQSFHNKRGVYFQLQVENAQKDQGLEITKVQYTVTGLSGKGVQQAAQTTRTRR